nr:MAG TPA: hypothetical protein [Caudoviricetes sp.]DAP80887.1 MAG TPA: hypothetical protein [Caudoviricetes sp.]
MTSGTLGRTGGAGACARRFLAPLPPAKKVWAEGRKTARPPSCKIFSP